MEEEDVNPCLSALKEAWLLVHTLFVVMCLTSTMDDKNWHSVDIDTVKEPKVGVLQWSKKVSVEICKERMTYCPSTELEDSSRSVLVDFQNLYHQYYAYHNSSKSRKREEQGLDARAAGGQKGQSRPTTPALVTGVLKVVSISAACIHRD